MSGNVAIESCPGQLQWSAFGAPYMDTRCAQSTNSYFLDTGKPIGPYLQDDDSEFAQQDVPCPFCAPAAFLEHYWGEPDEYVVIWSDGTIAPAGTEIHFHDGPSLWWSATHPERGEERVGIRSVDAEDDQ